jgi:hypothetical protein
MSRLLGGRFSLGLLGVMIASGCVVEQPTPVEEPPVTTPPVTGGGNGGGNGGGGGGGNTNVDDTDVTDDTDGTVVDTGPFDFDGDGVWDHEDNCDEDVNPNQADMDLDEVGDLCDDDLDGDFIPNDFDPFPSDGDKPGVGIANMVYAQTSSKLFTMNVKTYGLAEVGSFTGTDGSGVTDIALDRYGVLYAMTFNNLYVCHPQTTECWYLAGLAAGSSNGMTFVPMGTILQTQDALVGISSGGTWNHMTVQGSVVTQVQYGSYGTGYSSSGDAFSIEDIGTFASVNKTGASGDVIVEINPKTGEVEREILTLSHSSTFGLAGWEDLIFAFDCSGDIILIDPLLETHSVIVDTSHCWWGAGVRTVRI